MVIILKNSTVTVLGYKTFILILQFVHLVNFIAALQIMDYIILKYLKILLMDMTKFSSKMKCIYTIETAIIFPIICH